MFSRVLNLALALAVLAGGVMAWRSGRERARSEAEHARLTRRAGDLPVADPSRLHLRAIDTGEPLHFAWRAYLPPNGRFDHRSRMGAGASWSGGWSSSADAREFHIRVRFREADGRLHVYWRGLDGSGSGTVGDQALADLIRGRERELVVEQLGAHEVAAPDPDRPAVLLRISLSEAMKEELRRSDPQGLLSRFDPALSEFEIGPEAPPP